MSLRGAPDESAAPVEMPGFAFTAPDSGVTQPDSGPPDVVKLAPSCGLALWIVVAGSCAAGLGLAYLPLLEGSAGYLLLVAYGWRVMRLHVLLRHPAAVVALRCTSSGISYQLRNGKWLNGNLLNGGLVNRWVTLMRIRDNAETRQVRYIVITWDRISTQGFRVSRRFMLWSRQGREDASP